ncbi:uncharacterized protein YjbI with pentapeptide repeats [Peribacillus cavernae]|nr:uncharacterized protein YjbI with pentapeptide repeats [Peribacillus cavernae]
MQSIKTPASPAPICNRIAVAVFTTASDSRDLKGVLFLTASAQDKKFPKSRSEEPTGVKVQKRRRKCSTCSQLQQLHEMLWYLAEALTLKASRPIHRELSFALDETERLTQLSPDSLMELDVPSHRADVNALLLRTSELVRTESRRQRKSSKKSRKIDRRGADLIGANLRGADFRGADLRGAYLIAADLRDADLRVTDLIGTDLRDADLRGADLTDSIFLTQVQINSAKGDTHTKLPHLLSRPTHWSVFEQKNK